MVKDHEQNTITSCIEKEKATRHPYKKFNTTGYISKMRRKSSRYNAIDQINLIIFKKDENHLE